MALNKRGIDVSAIKRDQAAIDKLPNKGRASVDHSKATALKKRTATHNHHGNEWGSKAAIKDFTKEYGGPKKK